MTSTPSMTANDCTALSFVDSSNFSGRLCHNATHGRTILRMADDSEYSVLMRVSGPHPQTKLFERAESQEWIADFQLCAPGLYGASILLISSSAVDPYVVRKAGPSVGPSRAACPQFHLPHAMLLRRVHTWQLSAESAKPASSASCAGLWHWHEHGHRDFEHADATALRASAAGCSGSWKRGDVCSTRNMSLNNNIRPPPARVDVRTAQDSLATIQLTGYEFFWQSGRHRGYSNGHPWAAPVAAPGPHDTLTYGDLAATYSALSWTPLPLASTLVAHGGGRGARSGGTSTGGATGSGTTISGGALDGHDHRSSHDHGGGKRHGAMHGAWHRFERTSGMHNYAGGRWRSALPAGSCVCLMGDSAMRNLAVRLVQRWSPECHQETMQDSLALFSHYSHTAHSHTFTPFSHASQIPISI